MDNQPVDHFLQLTNRLEPQKYNQCPDTTKFKYFITALYVFSFKLMSMEDDVPEGLNDAWQLCGSLKDVEFTWDCRKNDNIEFPGKFKPRCRFDRIFVKQADPPVSNLVDFRLIGIERIRSCLCFPSDHFGVCCEFNLC